MLSAETVSAVQQPLRPLIFVVRSTWELSTLVDISARVVILTLCSRWRCFESLRSLQELVLGWMFFPHCHAQLTFVDLLAACIWRQEAV